MQKSAGRKLRRELFFHNQRKQSGKKMAINERNIMLANKILSKKVREVEELQKGDDVKYEEN